MILNLSYEMIHALMRASASRQDELIARYKTDTQEYELLNAFELMTSEIITDAKMNGFDITMINKPAQDL